MPDTLRDQLITTYRTGCRPQESLRVAARYVDLANARRVFPQQEAKGRRAHLDDESLEITKRLLRAVTPVCFGIAGEDRGLAML